MALAGQRRCLAIIAVTGPVVGERSGAGSPACGCGLWPAGGVGPGGHGRRVRHQCASRSSSRRCRGPRPRCLPWCIPRRAGRATGGGDPLDVGRVHQPVAVRASGRRRGGQPQPANRGGIDGDAGLDLAHDLAAVLGLPRRPAEVGDDELAVVVVQIRPGCDETPGEAARGGISGVDLNAGPVADQEHLVAGRNLDLAPDRRRPWPGLGHGLSPARPPPQRRSPPAAGG